MLAATARVFDVNEWMSRLTASVTSAEMDEHTQIKAFWRCLVCRTGGSLLILEYPCEPKRTSGGIAQVDIRVGLLKGPYREKDHKSHSKRLPFILTA